MGKKKCRGCTARMSMYLIRDSRDARRLLAEYVKEQNLDTAIHPGNPCYGVWWEDWLARVEQFLGEGDKEG
jgi:hypothetical protein